jgi:hypothetical protein
VQLEFRQLERLGLLLLERRLGYRSRELLPGFPLLELPGFPLLELPEFLRLVQLGFLRQVLG